MREDQKPRALTIIKGINTSDNTVQEVFKAMQEFQVNALHVVKKDASEVLDPPPPPPAPKPPKVGEIAPPSPFLNGSQTSQVSQQITIKINPDVSILINGQKTDMKSLPEVIKQITKEKEIDTAFIDAPVIKVETANSLKNTLKENGIDNIILKTSPIPLPEDPFKMIQLMDERGADFYYNGNKITAEKAKKLFKTKDNLNFMADESVRGGKPMILITD